MHDPLDDHQWGWHNWGLSLERHQRGAWNLPIPEEEAIPWVRNPRPNPSWDTQRSLNHQSFQSRLLLSPPDPPSKPMLLVCMFLPPLHPNLAATLPRRQRKFGERLGLTQTMQVSGSAPTCRQMKECQNGGGSSDLFSAPRMSTLVTSRP